MRNSLRFFLGAGALLIGQGAQSFTLNSGGDSTVQGWVNHAVAFRLNRANCPAGIDAILADAIGVWNAVPTSDLVVSIAGDTTTTVSELSAGTASDVPVIICDPNFSSDSGLGGNGVAGVARVATPPVGGNISYAYLLINVENGSTGNVASANPTVVSLVLAHEIGHVLGLGHSPDVNALMYYDASAKTNLSLAQDDIDGITYLYPRDEMKKAPMGCGIVAGGPVPPRPPGQILALLLMLMFPLGLAAALRKWGMKPVRVSTRRIRD